MTQRIELNRMYHPYPAVWTLVFYAAGIAAGWKWIGTLPVIWLITALFIAFAVVLLCFFFWSKYLFIPAFILFFLAGAARLNFQLAYFSSGHLINTARENIRAVRGTISKTEYRKDGKHRYLFSCDSVYIDGVARKTAGTILLYQGKTRRRFTAGDILKINRTPQFPPLPSNPGAFNYRRYLHFKGIYHVLYLPDEDNVIRLGRRSKSLNFYTLLEPLRAALRRNIDRYIPETAAAVVKALVLGERQDVERNLLEEFQKTGVIHVLAISGLHVGFILIIFLLLFSLLRLPYTLKIISSLGMLLLFAALVDFKTPVVRASLMIFLYYLAQFMERRPKALNILAGAGLLLLFFDPAQLLQPGFQFSFAAVFGILYGFLPFFEVLAHNKRLPLNLCFFVIFINRGHSFMVRFRRIGTGCLSAS